MLQQIRDRSQGWFAIVIISFICITFALWGIHSYLEGGSGQVNIAEVNGEAIPKILFDKTYERVLRQQQLMLKGQFVLTPDIEKQLKEKILNDLITSKLLLEKAKTAGYSITPQQLNATILSIPAFQQDGRFSQQRFQELLSTTLYSEAEFLNNLKEEMLIGELHMGIGGSDIALPGEVKRLLSLFNETRNIGYAVISKAKFISQMHITDEEINKYYQSHHPDFMSPEQVSINYIELSLADVAQQQKISDKNAEQFYQQNIASYTKPEQWQLAYILIPATGNDDKSAVTKLQSVQNRLAKGEAFAKLAQEFSGDVITAKKGGELGWLAAPDLKPEIVKALTDKKLNDITAPVKTQYGYEIYKITGIKAKQAVPYAEAKQQIVKTLAEQNAQKLFADYSDKLANLTFENPASLESAALALNTTQKSTDLFTKEGTKGGITAAPKVIAAAFSPDVLQGNNSDPIEVEPGKLVVLRIKQHIPSRLLPLTDVQGQIQNLLKNKAAEHAAKESGLALLQEISQKHAAPEEVFKQQQLQWRILSQLKRADNQVDQSILLQAFKLSPSADKNQPHYISFALPSGDYVVLGVFDIKDEMPVDLNPAAIQQLTQQVALDYGEFAYGLYVQNASATAKITKK